MSHTTAQKLRSKGFTLLELLVVIAIIGLLAGIATISFGSARAKARDARRVSEVKQYQTALSIYNESNTKFPTSATPNTTPPVFMLKPVVLGGGPTAVATDLVYLDNDTTKLAFKKAADPVIGTILLTKINAAQTPIDGSCGTVSTAPSAAQAGAPAGTTGFLPATVGASTAVEVQNAYRYISYDGTGFALQFCIGQGTGGLGQGEHWADANGLQ